MGTQTRRDATQHERKGDQGDGLDEDLREGEIGRTARGKQHHHAQARDRDQDDAGVALAGTNGDDSCRDHHRSNGQLHRRMEGIQVGLPIG